MHLQKSICSVLSLISLGSNAAWSQECTNFRPAPVAVSMAGELRGTKLMPELSQPPGQMADTPSQKGNAESQYSNLTMVEPYLIDGKLDAGESALRAQLRKVPNDDQARFGLGMLQFLTAVEGLGQGLYRYGLRDFTSRGFVLPFLRLPLRANPKPEKVSYENVRQIFEKFRAKLMIAETTLAAITDGDVRLPLHFGLIRLDLNGDGRSDEDDMLWKVYMRINNRQDITAEQARDFYIKFDRGDVHWLRGYCHLLSSVCDMLLAHDFEETFNCIAHMFFMRVETPYQFLSKGKHFRNIGEGDADVLDLIALVHLIRWKVIEPKRMVSALHHLEAVIEQSRETWKWIMAETDDDHEWLPNPSQTGVIPNVSVTNEMVTAWSEIMNESEKILAGKLLIPFWRGTDGSGINVREVFLHPSTFDLVLWAQGTAAAPYLQHGPLTKGVTWRRWQGEFGSNFPGFALWFN